MPASADEVVEPVNEVVIVGRLTADPLERELPSGDRIISVRIAVPRGDGRSDGLEATMWTAKLRRSATTWRNGDVVQIHGHLRRRFWRTPSGAASRWDIEVTQARRWRGRRLA